MILDLIKHIRDEIAASYLKNVPLIDNTCGKAYLKKGEDGTSKPIYIDVPAPLYIRLDNEHGIETNMSHILWHDNDCGGYLVWFESPMRGNTFAFSTMGNDDKNVPPTAIVSFADYDQIQQISWIPNQSQMEKFLQGEIGKGIIDKDNKLDEKMAKRIWESYCVDSRQAIRINASEMPLRGLNAAWDPDKN